MTQQPTPAAAIAHLASIVTKGHKILDDLAHKHTALADEVHHLKNNPTGDTGASSDTTRTDGLCWKKLPTSAQPTAWKKLLDWTEWFVDRYTLHDEIPACWPHHNALVEELSALCIAWHYAYDNEAAGSSPLWWHEALHRARSRWQHWQRHTNCHRDNQHRTDEPIKKWPDTWRQDTETALNLS